MAPAAEIELDDPKPYIFGPVDPNRLNQDSVFAIKNRARRFRDRLGSSHSCYGYSLPSGEVVSYIWLSVAPSHNTTVPIRFGIALTLAKRQAYVWDCATSSAHQNRGLYQAGLAHARRIAAKSGVANVFICADIDNDASVRGIRGANFHPYCKATIRLRGPIRTLSRDGWNFRVFLGKRTVALFEA